MKCCCEIFPHFSSIFDNVPFFCREMNSSGLESVNQDLAASICRKLGVPATRKVSASFVKDVCRSVESQSYMSDEISEGRSWNMKYLEI